MTSQKSPFSKDGLTENSRLNTALSLSGVGCWELDLSNDQFWMSENFKSIFGFKGEDIIAYEELLELIYTGDRQKTRRSFQEALRPGSDGTLNIETRILIAEEQLHHWLSWRGQVTFATDGVPEHFSGIVCDISKEVRGRFPSDINGAQAEEDSVSQYEKIRIMDLEYINQELATVNTEYTAANDELEHINELLRRSNENLQQFAYVASHDLQEPLRKISSFGELLRSRFLSELGEGVEYLDRMQAAARRMSKMIDDLLVFSRVNIADSEPASVELNKVISDVINDLEIPVQQTHAAISASDLPRIKGDERQLVQLFQNLIGNALKFTKPNVPPEIRIEWTIIKGTKLPEYIHPSIYANAYNRIDVSDNGIGFDPKNKERIFKVFQRLHGKSEFEGTGIGLAICEKVVANHGGAIRAESEVGAGSRFSIYFPI